MEPLLSFPDESVLRRDLDPGWQLMRYRHHRIAMYISGDAALGDVLVKVYKPKNAADALLSGVLGDRCERSYKMALALRADNLPTPEPVAVARRGDVRVLATRALPEHTLLTEYLKAQFIRESATGTAREKRALLARVADLASTLHRAGFVHGDLTASNIVVDGEGNLHLIDLDRTKRPTLARAFLQMLDVRLLFLTSWGEVSRSEWLRLLARYMRPWGWSRHRKRRFVRRVLGAKRGRVRLGARGDVAGGRVPYGKGPESK